MIPEKLGRYEILGELGKGAMGVVYLGRDPIIGRQVALKTFRLGYSADDDELEQFRARFLREAQSAGILNHPNIVTIHDVVEEEGGGAFFIAMEYVKGTDLKHLLQRQGRLELPFVLDVVAQIADGLDYAHSKGVVHRDIKPANIILTIDKEVKITDFGIARVDASNLTMEGQLLGTPNYMAPEQIQGKEVDHRADLFSLGVMLYEMLTGKKPFSGDNLTVVTHRIVHDAFTPPEEYVRGLPAPVVAVLDRALQKDPAKRYARGAEMARELRGVLRPEPVAVAGGAAAARRPSGSLLRDSSPPAATSSAAAVASAPAAAAPAGRPRELPRPAAPPPPRDRASLLPPPGRLALVAGLAAVAALAAGGLASYLLVPRIPPLPPPDPEAMQQLQYLPLVKEGLTHLAEQRPAEALESFERALAVAPDNRQLRRLRDRAEREVLTLDGVDAEQEYVSSRLEAAQAALDRRDYVLALDLTQEILEVDPENADAERIATRARAGRERRVETAQRLTGPLSGRRGERADPSAGTPADPRPVGRAELQIEFESEVSEGILTIYALHDQGQEQVYRESFRFGEKGGIFRRGRKSGGHLSGSYGLPAGEIGLKVYVYRKDAPIRYVEVAGNLAAGSRPTLDVHLAEDGLLTAHLR